MNFEANNMVRNQANRMEQIRQAAVRFTLYAQELRLTPSEARMAANLMNRNAQEFLRPDCVDGKAAPDQILFLESKGFQNVHEWSELTRRNTAQLNEAPRWVLAAPSGAVKTYPRKSRGHHGVSITL